MAQTSMDSKNEAKNSKEILIENRLVNADKI